MGFCSPPLIISPHQSACPANSGINPFSFEVNLSLPYSIDSSFHSLAGGLYFLVETPYHCSLARFRHFLSGILFHCSLPISIIPLLRSSSIVPLLIPIISLLRISSVVPLPISIIPLLRPSSVVPCSFPLFPC